MYPWLEDAIGRNATVITASRRLARELRAAYAANQIHKGMQSWPTPPIHAWHDWCRRQVDAVSGRRELALVLDDHCSAVLWERCLKECAPQNVPAFRGLLRQARDAWQKLRDWNVPVSALASTARSADERLFAAAAKDYQAMLQSRSCADSAGTPWLVAGLLRDSALEAPESILFAGFDRLSPAVAEVIDALKAAGCETQIVAAAEPAARIRIASFDDHDAEMRAAGAWARDALLQDPAAHVAIVDPELQNDAGREARLVREGLAPGWQYGQPAYQGAVDVSFGQRLADFPGIAVALLITKWLRRGLSTKEISLLLRSRCVAGEYIGGRGRLELALRQLPDRAWRAGDLRRVLENEDDGADSRDFFRGLDAVATIEAEGRGDASPAHWAGRIDALLDAWAWPGTETLTSSEFQLVNRWRGLLNELAATAIITPRLSLGEAVERLVSLAEDVVFQPQAEGGLVALMGTLEAAGMQFDRLWVCGMHAGLWPPPGNPSPLLSRNLQKEYGMPDATPADTLGFSRRVFDRLTRSAPKIVFSWPRTDGEAELARSGFLDDMRNDMAGVPDDPGWHAVRFCGDEASLGMAEDAVPALDPGELVRGGAYTVQRQFDEPFAAFAYGRLGIKRPDAIESGIAARVRGNLIHDALHNLYVDRPAQADIRHWAASELNRRLGAAIDAALYTPLRYADETHARILSLERRRLFRLLQDFIAKELARSEFAVADVEKEVDYEACGVRLKLRIDRIDRLADRSLLVIDYKTGSSKKAFNKTNESADLQLVVYADSLDATVGEIAIVNIDSRSISYDDVDGRAESDAANSDEWPGWLARWRSGVHDLLAQIAAGDVRVNLRQKATDGRPLAILSRLEELKRAH